VALAARYASVAVLLDSLPAAALGELQALSC